MAVLRVRSSGDSAWYTIGGWPSISDTNYFLDEDDMASDSVTHGATQQSIKAYVDNSIVTRGTGYTFLNSNTAYTLVSGLDTDWCRIRWDWYGQINAAVNYSGIQLQDSTGWVTSGYTGNWKYIASGIAYASHYGTAWTVQHTTYAYTSWLYVGFWEVTRVGIGTTDWVYHYNCHYTNYGAGQLGMTWSQGIRSLGSDAVGIRIVCPGAFKGLYISPAETWYFDGRYG